MLLRFDQSMREDGTGWYLRRSPSPSWAEERVGEASTIYGTTVRRGAP